jgi:hypothetical protein
VLKKDPKTYRNVPDWWATSKKMLAELELKKLVDFDNLKQMNEGKHQKLFLLFNDEETKNFLEE